MNQSIIIRNEEDQDLGIVGENLVSPNWLTQGFTIALWVRFLTKTKGGTLFNFGNPIRNISPYGFRLDTFTVQESQYNENSILPSDAFSVDSNERFLRLMIFEPDVGLRDSHFGTNEYQRISTIPFGNAYDYNQDMAFNYISENWLGASKVSLENSMNYCLVRGSKYLDQLFYGTFENYIFRSCK